MELSLWRSLTFGRGRLATLRQKAVVAWASILFEAQLVRLRAERVVSAILRRGRGQRVVATACWSFPIYSQTFVYQELTQLLRRGFDVRFLYSQLNSADQLPSQFRPLWRARRRLGLHPAVCERSFAYFRDRAPDRVEELLEDICRVSGRPAAEVRTHYHFLQAFAFTRMVEACRPDYLHSYFFYEGTLFTFIASRLLGIRRGVSCYADHMLDDYALKVVPLHLQQCCIVVATSQRIKQELLRIEPTADPAKIIVKPNGINVDRFPVTDRREPQRGEPYRIVTVCRIEPKKGLLDLVNAVRLLRDRGIAVELHLIGAADDTDASRRYLEEVRARVRDLDLQQVVHLEGRRSEEDINTFFTRAHLFVAPFVETAAGDKDGVPTSLLEGMAAGLPVVATNAGSISEVVEHGRDAVIVPQRDPEAIAAAAAALIENREERARLGRNAARRVREAFDASACEQVFHDRLAALVAPFGDHPDDAVGRTPTSGDTDRPSSAAQSPPPAAGDAVTPVEFGSLRRVTPISANWGFDRGLPVDRYYIERFLARCAHDIRGRVLEIEDDMYTRRFGEDRVTARDILHVNDTNERATIVGDLAGADHIPSNHFDCVILTQTLHIIYDTRAALKTLNRILKPGGVLLGTFPGLSRISHDEWAGSWYWGFTTASARRLFEEAFSPGPISVEAFGNVLTASAFLYGLAAEDLRRDELDHQDPDFEVLIAVRAVRAADGS